LHCLTSYGHSWVQGAGASRPARRLVDVASRRLGCAPTNLGVGGTLSTDTADLVAREPPPVSRLYVLITGLNDARLYGASPVALGSFTAALEAILGGFARAHPEALTVTVEQPHLADYSRHAPHDVGSHEVLDAYNQRLREVVSPRPGVVLASVTEWHPGTMLAEDTVHPNDAGHSRVAAAVVRAAHDRGLAEVSGPFGVVRQSTARGHGDHESRPRLGDRPQAVTGLGIPVLGPTTA